MKEKSAFFMLLIIVSFKLLIDPALMDCTTAWVPHPRDVYRNTVWVPHPRDVYRKNVWVPHPRDAFVFVARVGEHNAILLVRINRTIPETIVSTAATPGHIGLD
jgi:hypothetical protein